MSKWFVCFVIVLASVLWPGVVLAQQPVATAAPAAVIVEWTTESEVNLAGFNIHRSESLDGPYVRLNATLIPASPDPIAGGSYSYTDSTAEAGGTYYYKLEDVELDGRATMHGPITVVAEGNVVSQVSQAGVLIALLAAGVLVGSAIFVISRSVSAASQRRVSAPRPAHDSSGRAER